MLVAHIFFVDGSRQDQFYRDTDTDRQTDNTNIPNRNCDCCCYCRCIHFKFYFSHVHFWFLFFRYFKAVILFCSWNYNKMHVFVGQGATWFDFLRPNSVNWTPQNCALLMNEIELHTMFKFWNKISNSQTWPSIPFFFKCSRWICT